MCDRGGPAARGAAHTASPKQASRIGSGGVGRPARTSLQRASQPLTRQVQQPRLPAPTPSRPSRAADRPPAPRTGADAAPKAAHRPQRPVTAARAKNTRDRKKLFFPRPRTGPCHPQDGGKQLWRGGEPGLLHLVASWGIEFGKLSGCFSSSIPFHLVAVDQVKLHCSFSAYRPQPQGRALVAGRSNAFSLARV